jgi:hypothetical protein
MGFIDRGVFRGEKRQNSGRLYPYAGWVGCL